MTRMPCKGMSEPLQLRGLDEAEKHQLGSSADIEIVQRVYIEVPCVRSATVTGNSPRHNQAASG